MDAKENQTSDVVITWPRKEQRLRHIQKSGMCPSYGCPLHAKPHAWVALADPYGFVLLLFRIKRIEPHRRVVGANGKTYNNGYMLIAEPGSMRWKPKKYPEIKRVNQHIGAIGYYDPRTGDRINYSREAPPPPLPPSPPPRPRSKPPRIPFLANNLGKQLSKPEADLINRYVHWLGGSEHRFEHRHLKSVDLFTDLYIRRHNILIEAKVYTDRKTTRTAIGQLFDYRRYFRRAPKLALLVPYKLSASLLTLLKKLKIACIWETKRGYFNDTSKGALTRRIRHLPAKQ